MPAVPDLMWGVYVRGFVETARVGLTDVRATLELAFAAAPLRFLSVSGLRTGQLRELLEFPLLGRLTALNLPSLTGNREARLLIAEARARCPNTEIVD